MSDKKTIRNAFDFVEEKLNDVNCLETTLAKSMLEIIRSNLEKKNILDDDLIIE